MLLLSMTVMIRVGAQQAEQQQVVQLLQKVKERYQHLNDVYMDIKYYYANERTPGKYLDSIQGSLVLREGAYKINMQQVETTTNEHYSISLFKEDHLMYLSRPSSMRSFNPTAVLDSLFNRLKGVRCSVTTENGLQVAKVELPSPDIYKSMAFVVDTVTGYLVKSILVLKTEYMTQGADPASLKQQGYDEYAIVETRFSGFRQEKLADDFFSESRFFTRTDKDFQVTDAYRDYKIFVATPNL